MYSPVLVTAPAIKPVTRTEAKAALDVAYTDKDDLIDGLIAAATAHLDGWPGILGIALCEQTWRQDFDCFDSKLRLPLGPVISITSVKYLDTAGVEQTVSSTNYTTRKDDLGYYVEFISTYSAPAISVEPASVRVTYKAGYADAAGVSTVPNATKQLILLLIRHWFDNPTAVVVGASVEELPFAVRALVSAVRIKRF